MGRRMCVVNPLNNEVPLSSYIPVSLKHQLLTTGETQYHLAIRVPSASYVDKIKLCMANIYSGVRVFVLSV